MSSAVPQHASVCTTLVSLQVPDFVNQPLQTPQLLGYALPATAKFFFTYMILR